MCIRDSFKTSNILIKAIKASFNTTESFELREDADMRNFVYRYSMFLTSLSGKFSTMKQNEYKLFAIEAEDSNQPNKRLQKENPYYIDQYAFLLAVLVVGDSVFVYTISVVHCLMQIPILEGLQYLVI